MWTEKQIQILKKHYPLGGYSVVKEILPYTNRQIRSKAISLKIKITKDNNRIKPETESLKDRNFGKWTVIKFYGYINRNAQWLCRCECGLTKPVKAQYLLSGNSKSCVKCCNPRANYIHEIPPKIWEAIVKRATRRNQTISITKKYAYKLFLKQNKLCALTGIPLYIPVNASEYLERKGTASIDRIDSGKGYTPENVQWVHKDVNRMKNAFSQNYFVKMCNLIAKNHPINSSSVGPFLMP